MAGPEVSVPTWKLEVLDQARKVQSERGGFSGADHLHKRITGEHWGITARELQGIFLNRVRQLLAAGKVQNVGRVEYPQEKFDDPAIGPNMYQITDQVIMPVTAEQDLEFPGVSWALMSNPVGNVVTIFVTHAWAEGVFEFAHHVLAKWPQGLGPGGVEQAAYICFLSNPQHLDISEMLREIETSPFKVALNRMPQPGLMIVAPTEACPIHSRLWCVAELFWASEGEIPIVVGGHREQLAQAEKSKEMTVAIQAARRRRRMPMMIGGFGILILVGILSGPSLASTIRQASEYDHDAWSDMTNWTIESNATGYSSGAHRQSKQSVYEAIEIVIIAFALLSFCCCAGFFCFWGGVTLQVGKGWLPLFLLLRAEDHAFSGALIDIRAASCTVEEDARRIRAAMQGREDEVNQKLGHLIVYGSSSKPTLQKDLDKVRKDLNTVIDAVSTTRGDTLGHISITIPVQQPDAIPARMDASPTL